ncbi:MAG: 50S ribosomal protein L9 [Bacilli bacterium]|jgi:large subunit ribosomal protein L9|nr:50S ribosomal protein L9 [Bacteroidia bacterium]
MKVIMLQDVKNVGKKDQVVNVSDGYAMNFLFPRNLAVKVSERSMEIKSEQESARQAEEATRKAEALTLKGKLEELTVTVQAKSGKDGKMFGSISTKQIVEVLKSQHQLVVDKKKFIHNAPIAVFGVTVMAIELYKGVVANLRVHVREQD